MPAASILAAQSALAPAGIAAERLFDLFWWMAAGGTVIWLAFIGLAVYTLRARPESRNHGRANLLIIGGGAIIPTVVLGVVLVYGLALLPDLLAPAPEEQSEDCRLRRAVVVASTLSTGGRSGGRPCK